MIEVGGPNHDESSITSATSDPNRVRAAIDTELPSHPPETVIADQKPMKMCTSEEITTPTVEYWIRDGATTAVHERQREVYRQLQRYEDTEQINSLDVNVWRACIQRFTGSDDGTEAALDEGSLATYRRFEDWATETGYDLEPGFHRCVHTSLVSTERYEVVAFPLLCLAIYDEAELQAVFPCSTGERMWSVEDGLSLLDPAQPMSWDDFATEPVRTRGDSSGQDVST